MVSSCAHLPWMMEVCPLRAWLSTAFQTLLTQGQVVSTIWTSRSFSSRISCTEAPKAGRMTTSPLRTAEKSLSAPSLGASMKKTSISLSRWFTPGGGGGGAGERGQGRVSCEVGGSQGRSGEA